VTSKPPMTLHGAAQLRFMDQQEGNQTSFCPPTGEASAPRQITELGGAV
jgi:hypothetical protein